MPKFVFTADFNWKAKPRVHVSYKAGTEMTIPRRAAEAAMAAKAGHYKHDQASRRRQRRKALFSNNETEIMDGDGPQS